MPKNRFVKVYVVLNKLIHYAPAVVVVAVVLMALVALVGFIRHALWGN